MPIYNKKRSCVKSIHAWIQSSARIDLISWSARKDCEWFCPDMLFCLDARMALPGYLKDTIHHQVAGCRPNSGRSGRRHFRSLRHGRRRVRRGVQRRRIAWCIAGSRSSQLGERGAGRGVGLKHGKRGHAAHLKSCETSLPLLNQSDLV
jgi:hypothetical protein